MAIKFFKTEKGSFILTDVRGRDSFISKDALTSAVTYEHPELGTVVSVRVHPAFHDRFGYIERDSPILVGEFEGPDDFYTEEQLKNVFDDFFLKAPAPNGGGSTLDFLFVDAWTDYMGDVVPMYVPEQIKIGMVLITSNEDGTSICKIINEQGNVENISGFGSDPYVPISKNTIFVHPTTFERYRFNGTTMEVYNDVDNVVPKWRTYKALLTQEDENAPVARVLNQDETDYLGDVIWMIDDVGSFYVYLGAKNDKLILVSSSEIRKSLGEVRVTNDEQYVFLMTYGNDGQLSNGVLAGRTVSIEIKVRQRGAPPKLLSAETNAAGDKVILTFDKEMSGYGLDTVQYGDGIRINNTEIGILLVEAFDKKIIIHIDPEQIPNSETELNVSFMEGFVIESLDYGLLQPFENFPVVNNVQ